jgi:hypothetical protein
MPNPADFTSRPGPNPWSSQGPPIPTQPHHIAGSYTHASQEYLASSAQVSAPMPASEWPAHSDSQHRRSRGGASGPVRESSSKLSLRPKQEPTVYLDDKNSYPVAQPSRKWPEASRHQQAPSANLSLRPVSTVKYDSRDPRDLASTTGRRREPKRPKSGVDSRPTANATPEQPAHDRRDARSYMSDRSVTPPRPRNVGDTPSQPRFSSGASTSRQRQPAPARSSASMAEVYHYQSDGNGTYDSYDSYDPYDSYTGSEEFESDDPDQQNPRSLQPPPPPTHRPPVATPVKQQHHRQEELFNDQYEGDESDHVSRRHHKPLKYQTTSTGTVPHTFQGG